MSRKPKRLMVGFSFALVIAATGLLASWSIERRERLSHEMVNAVVAGRTVDVAAALEQGADPNARYFSKDSPNQGFWAYLKSLFHPQVDNRDSAPVLFYAVREHHVEITRLLLKHGARIEAIDKAPPRSIEGTILGLTVSM